MTHQKIPVQFLLFWKDLKPSGCQGCLHSIKRLAGVSGLTITDNVDITCCDIPDVVEDVQYIVKSEIVDKEGDKVANITVHWRLGLKKQEYGQYGQVCSFCQQ